MEANKVYFPFDGGVDGEMIGKQSNMCGARGPFCLRRRCF